MAMAPPIDIEHANALVTGLIRRCRTRIETCDRAARRRDETGGYEVPRVDAFIVTTREADEDMILKLERLIECLNPPIAEAGGR